MPFPIDFYWGVDSWNPVHKPIPQLGNRTLFDVVVAQMGMVPQFWGRYIGLDPRLTADEADYIFSHSHNQCRILVVYNGLNDAPPTQLPTGQRLLTPGSVRNGHGSNAGHSSGVAPRKGDSHQIDKAGIS